MTRYISVVLLFFLWIPLQVLTQVSVEGIELLDDVANIEKAHFGEFKKVESQNASSYDVKYYRLDLSVNPSVRFISGSVTIYFVPDIDLTQIMFDFSSIMEVDSVYAWPPAVYSHSNDIVVVNRSFVAGILDSVTIFYHGEPDSTNRAFIQTKHSGAPIIWTLSEPYGSHLWWPCKESLIDKADSSDLIVTVPLAYKVAGNGVLISEDTVGLKKIVRWKNRYPIVPYLIAFSVTNYTEFSYYTSLSTGELLVQNYVYPESMGEDLIMDLLITDTLLRLYDTLIGPYPFFKEKYGHAQFGWGGGMEHQTMSFMYHFKFSLNAHELAHQWFGNKITCGSWHDLWINEGFASYFTGIAFEKLKGDSLWMEWKREVLAKVVSEPEGSVYILDTTDLDRMFDSRLTYRKGAYVLHMLRYQIGDGAFFDGIRNFLNDSGLAYKTALTEDFFRHMEATSGEDLQWYVNEWIYGEGYPSYNVVWEQVGDEIHMKVHQTTSANISFFHNRIPIRLANSFGDTLMIDIEPVESGQEFFVRVGFEVEEVRIDPELNIISKGNFTIRSNRVAEFRVYPNPVSEKMKVVPGKDLGRLKSYRVYSPSGELVLVEAEYNVYQNSSIDVSFLPQGVYILVFEGEKAERIVQFVVAR